MDACDITVGRSDSLQSTDSVSSITSSMSDGSMIIQLSSDDLKERSPELLSENSLSEEIRRRGRTNKLLKRHNLKIPNLAAAPLLLKHEGNVDLSEPKSSADWLSKKFPHIYNNKRLPKKPVVHVTSMEREKENLRASLASKRKQGQQRRKEMYEEDNEGLLDDQSEEEEEEYKPKKKVQDVAASENSEDDEEYDGGEESSNEGDLSNAENSDDEGEASNADQESLDLFETPQSSLLDPLNLTKVDNVINNPTNSDTIPSTSIESISIPLHDLPSQNVLPSSLSTQTIFPSSLSQWFRDDADGDDSPDYNHSGGPTNLIITEHMDDPGTLDDDELLLLCSGRFDEPLLSTRSVTKAVECETNLNEENDEESVPFHVQKKRKVVIESDDEVDNITDKKEEGTAIFEPTCNDVIVCSTDPSMDSNLLESVTGVVKPKRIVVISDDEDEEEGQPEDDEVENELGSTNAHNDGVEDDDNDSDDDGSVEGDEQKNDDSDDELAVYRNLQNKEFKRKSTREKFVDDEASLSGDDVGSDIDEDGENDEYESEEGDLDNVPDANTIRLQNHQHLMKLDRDRDHRDLAKLQDRLLADGDLGGSETDRTFRIRLRDQPEDVDVCGDDGDKELLVEEDDDEELRRRAEAMRFRLELQLTMASAWESEEVAADDLLESAATAAMRAKVVKTIQPKAAPSMLDKAPLAGVVKEITANASTTAKQLYTNTKELPAASKRPSSIASHPAKKAKISMLSSIEY